MTRASTGDLEARRVGSYPLDMSGRLIAIVGTSSVGKSLASARLQEILPDPYLTVGIDHFLNMFPQQWAGQPRGPGPGMWYEDSTDSDGAPRARIRYGQAGRQLLAGMQASGVSDGLCKPYREER